MILRISTITLIVVCFFILTLQAAELVIPLPRDAIKISEKGPTLGPFKSVHKRYKTSLNKNKLVSFYKREMIKEGWKEKDKGLAFIKDKDTVTILINQYQDNEGRTGFMISSSRKPESNEILAMRKKDPDKLRFMPIYPGSEQNSLWDFENGLSAEYETLSSIKEVVFFYKSGMLNYGWQLYEESPIKIEKIDCPSCKKLIPAGKGPQISDGGILSKTKLIFRKGKSESCVIEVTNASFEQDNMPQSKTTISVSYREYKAKI